MAGYVGLAEWISRNLLAYAEKSLDERLLVFALVLRSDKVLGPFLTRLWPVLWERCLSRTQLVYTGCPGDANDDACEELGEAWGCVADQLRPLIEEVTPWRSIEELHEKIAKALSRGGRSDPPARRGV